MEKQHQVSDAQTWVRKRKEDKMLENTFSTVGDK